MLALECPSVIYSCTQRYSLAISVEILHCFNQNCQSCLENLGLRIDTQIYFIPFDAMNATYHYSSSVDWYLCRGESCCPLCLVTHRLYNELIYCVWVHRLYDGLICYVWAQRLCDDLIYHVWVHRLYSGLIYCVRVQRLYDELIYYIWVHRLYDELIHYVWVHISYDEWIYCVGTKIIRWVNLSCLGTYIVRWVDLLCLGAYIIYICFYSYLTSHWLQTINLMS